ncbi:MAG: glycoside hydrolase, partial [Thermoplasmata archaeon]|nr:glycoside hydrolase [Thermoplasmata archaeon]
MRSRRIFGVPQIGRYCPVACVVAVLLLTGLVTASAPSARGVTAPSGTIAHPTNLARSSSDLVPGARLTNAQVSPAGTGGSDNLTFFQNATVPSAFPQNHMGCRIVNDLPYAFYDYCYNWTVNPTLVPLGGSLVGLSFQVSTNITSRVCHEARFNFSTEVGFSLSTDNGTTWGTPSIFANLTCAYTNSLEPSFAASGSDVYGVFVEDNETNFPYGFPNGEGTPGYLYGRSPSTLGFVRSSDAGASFTPVVSLKSGSYVAHPEIAVFGQTIYVVYEDIHNSSSTVATAGPYCCYYYPPVSVNYIYSTDGGGNWSSPVTLPGENATAGYFSLSPSIAVNTTGEIAVAYFTNQTCVWIQTYSYYYYYTTCDDDGMDLVALTSSDNGTSWSGPVVVERGVGMSASAAEFSSYPELPANWIPQTQIRFAPDGATLLLAFDGAYDTPTRTTNPYYYWSAGYLAMGPSNGSGPWDVRLVASDNTTTTENSFYLPSVGEANGTIYYAYEWGNDTSCSGSASLCPYLDGTLSWRVVTSTDQGASWVGPTILHVSRYSSTNSNPYDFQQSYQGFESAIAFTASGRPLVAYPAAQTEQYTAAIVGGRNVYTYTYSTALLVASPYLGRTVNVTFQENGAPPTSWGFDLEGARVSVVGSSSITVGNVPYGVNVLIEPLTTAAATGYGQVAVGSSSVPPLTTFTANATVYLNYTTSWAVQVNIAPAVVLSAQVEFYRTPTYYDVDRYLACNYYYSGCTPENSTSPSGTWYFPNGTVLDVGGSYSYGVSFWNGTGAGSFTGDGTQANITVDHYINETAWAGGFGVYDEKFNAIGLPAGSVYHFDFNGTSYATPAGQSAYSNRTVTGAYSVTNIWANSSLAGWEYFGAPQVDNPIIVPAEPIVNLSFAAVEVGAPVGDVTFHAVGLTDGTPWHFGFNGTEYSSTTPNLTVEAHPGTYPVAGYPVVAANGTVGYAPSGLNATLAVTTGSTYPIDFVDAYRVDVQAGLGGTYTSSTHGNSWLAAGSTASYHAVVQTNYGFGGWSGNGVGSYSGFNTYANVTVNGPITEVASFYPANANRFNLTFRESGLANGTWWSAYVGGRGYSSMDSQIIVPNL